MYNTRELLTFSVSLFLTGEGCGEAVEDVGHVGGAHEHEPRGLVQTAVRYRTTEILRVKLHNLK